MKTELQYIRTDKIAPHPDNPRKELGEMTELADSIKKNGIMQNLTVVYGERQMTSEEYKSACEAYRENPTEEGQQALNRHLTKGYTVVIGHRRLAAAKLAGLETVPCVIADLTPEEQIATMLLENMQRSDLTVYEQAQGFQMMLDMGETVATCAEKTGFSESTVRRRVKLLDLDAEKFKESERRGATLQDYMKLDKIQDPDLKNEVLTSIGTNNFESNLKAAIEKEKRQGWIDECVSILQTFAEKAEGDNIYSHFQYVKIYSWWNRSNGLPVKPEDADTVKYYYHIDTDQVRLFREKPGITEEEAEKEAAARREEAENRRREELREAGKRAYELRKQFICGISNTAAKKNIARITAFAALSLMESYTTINEDEFSELLGVDIAVNADDESTDYSQLYTAIERTPERAALFIAYLLSDDSEREGYSAWNGTYVENEDLDALYEFLCRLGYEMSDEEKALQDGTHTLFYTEKQGEN